MPVSDQLTIASKLLMPVWLAPLIVIAAITATWILGLLLLSAITVAEDLGSVSRLWLQSGILGGFFQELIGYLIQGFWALPLYSLADPGLGDRQQAAAVVGGAGSAGADYLRRHHF